MDKHWDHFIFFTVVVVLAMLVVELSFDLSNYKNLVMLFEWVVFLIFATDLYILNKRAKNFKHFLKRNWLDIIATIPFALIALVPYGIVFRGAKLLRLIKILKGMKVMKFLEAMRFVHIDRILKVFSKEDRLDESQNKKK